MNDDKYISMTQNMNDVFEAYLELQKQMMLAGMDAELIISLSNKDFDLLIFYLFDRNNKYIKYDLHKPIKECLEFQMAGPAGYMTFRRK